MSDKETEIKLQINDKSIIPVLAQFISALYMPGLSHITHMSAIYYDTDDASLRNMHWAYRIRKEDNIYIATIKGNSHNDHFITNRLEISKRTYSIKPDLYLFVNYKQVWSHIKSIANRSLKAIVSNVFQRRTFVVFFNSSKIEIALDRGYVYGQYKTSVICEVELELKKGNITDVITLSNILKAKFALTPSLCSKLSRGLAKK